MVYIKVLRCVRVILLTVLVTAFNSNPSFAATFMKTGDLTSQPIGHFDFCKFNTPECRIESHDLLPIDLNKKIISLLKTVNVQVNKSVFPEIDKNIYGRDEVWAYPTTFGDCEDYALLKRRLLMDKGISAGNLLITVVRKPDGEGHAVLTVRTKNGDYVLDNLTSDVMAWDVTGYTFLKRQAVEHSGRWVTINAPKDILVGSIGASPNAPVQTNSGVK
jgi:predicted transglutaminase-like cysteine proteinase